MKYLYHDSNYAQSVLFDILLVVKQMVILLSNAPERMKMCISRKYPYPHHGGNFI